MNREERWVPSWLAASVAVTWRLSFLVVVVLAMVFAMSRLWLVVLPVVVALLVAAVLSPPVRWLEARGLPSLAATWAVFLLVGGVLAGGVFLFGAQISEQASQLPAAVDEAVEEGRSWLTDGPLDLSEDDVDRWIERVEDGIGENRQGIVSGVVRYAFAALHLVAGTLITLVLAFFFVKDGPRMVEWTLEQFRDPARTDVAEVGRRIWSTLTGYVQGSALDGLAEAVLKAIGLLVLGVPLVLPLAILTFFGGFIPFVGALLAGVLSTLVALATEGPFTALLVAVLSVAIQNIEGDLLQPLIMGKVVKLHPVVVLLSVTAAGLLLGLPGAFLAVPTVASAANVIGYLRHERADASSRDSAPAAH